MEQKTIDWIKDERKTIETLQQQNGLYMKFEEGIIYELEIDFSKKFERVPDAFNPDKQRIRIPVRHLGIMKNWDLTPTNPIYRKLLDAGESGTTRFKLTRSGQGKDTRLQLLK